MRLPNTPGEFLDCILRGEREWTTDISSNGTPEFWLKTDDGKCSVVSFEHDALWVNLYHGNFLYDFELSRLHDDWPQWSWSRQVGDKNWAKPEHLDLLRYLESIFPKVCAGGVAP